MTPSDRPTNDNEALWENTPRGRRVMASVSVAVLVVIWGGAILWLGKAHWIIITAVLGFGFVAALVTAGVRRLLTGRA